MKAAEAVAAAEKLAKEAAAAAAAAKRAQEEVQQQQQRQQVEKKTTGAPEGNAHEAKLVNVKTPTQAETFAALRQHATEVAWGDHAVEAAFQVMRLSSITYLLHRLMLSSSLTAIFVEAVRG